MARVSTYLNFPRTTEAAFNFYKTVFGTQLGPVMRFADTSPQAGSMPEADMQLVMHVELPILAGHCLMGTDASEGMGHKLIQGNNSYINLEPDTRAETDKLFKALAEGANIETPLQEMFWGGYFGCLTDKFGVHWMFNCMSKS